MGLGRGSRPLEVSLANDTGCMQGLMDMEVDSLTRAGTVGLRIPKRRTDSCFPGSLRAIPLRREGPERGHAGGVHPNHFAAIRHRSGQGEGGVRRLN